MQFLDPLLLMSEARLSAGRRVSFLIAEKSYHRSFVGLASKIAQSSKSSLQQQFPAHWVDTTAPH